MFHLLKILQVIALGVVILASVLSFMPTPKKEKWPVVVPYYESVLSNQAAIVTVSSTVVGVLAIALKCIGSPKDWKRIHRMLENFHSETFSHLDDTDQPSEHHRVTMYRWKRWCLFPGPGWWPWRNGVYPWSGWLIPIVRVGSTNPGKTIFLAKSGNKDEFEGVAGAAYVSVSGDLPIEDLPNTLRADKKTLANYAQKGFVSIEWLERRVTRNQPCARCFRAVRLEVNNKPWGVMMIDTLQEKLPSPLITPHKLKQLVTFFRIIQEG